MKRSIVFSPIFDSLEPEVWRYLALPGASAANLTTISGYISTIKAGKPVTLSSLTAKFSTVAGTEFVTQASTDLRWLSFLGAKLTWSDGTNSAVTYAGAVGAGETVGADLLAGWNLTSGWAAGSNCTIDNATTFTTSAGGWGPTRSYFDTVGALYKMANVMTANCVPFLGNGAGRFAFANGATSYATRTAVDEKLYLRNTNAGTTVVTSMSAWKITTPSATGLVLTTPTWGTFNPNAVAVNLTAEKRDIP